MLLGNARLDNMLPPIVRPGALGFRIYIYICICTYKCTYMYICLYIDLSLSRSLVTIPREFAN